MPLKKEKYTHVEGAIPVSRLTIADEALDGKQLFCLSLPHSKN